MDKIGNIQVRSENIGFSANEMVGCGKCGKQNPPNRAACLYCGSGLELPEAVRGNIELDRRQPESWENGFNLTIFDAKVELVEQFPAAMLESSGITKDMLSVLPELSAAVPIIRTEKLTEAELLAERLSISGKQMCLTSDEELAADRPPTRLRSIEMLDENAVFHNFNNAEKTVVDIEDLRLIVTGTIYESKTSIKEKKKRKSSEIVDETQTVRDESVIDLYTAKDHNGFRIYTSGFDFSCLGQEKGLLAAENMLRLTGRLRQFFGAAKFIGDHSKVEEILEAIWPAEIRKDSMGFQQSIFAGRSSENLTTINNQQQFTKFSRLQSRAFNL